MLVDIGPATPPPPPRMGRGGGGGEGGGGNRILRETWACLIQRGTGFLLGFDLGHFGIATEYRSDRQEVIEPLESRPPLGPRVPVQC